MFQSNMFDFENLMAAGLHLMDRIFSHLMMRFMTVLMLWACKRISWEAFMHMVDLTFFMSSITFLILFFKPRVILYFIVMTIVFFVICYVFIGLWNFIFYWYQSLTIHLNLFDLCFRFWEAISYSAERNSSFLQGTWCYTTGPVWNWEDSNFLLWNSAATWL